MQESSAAHAVTVGHDGIVLRPLASHADYDEAVTLQDEIWGAGFSDRVPASILRVGQKVGGVSAAAFDPNGRMLGFVFGLTGVRGGRLVHWSDMLAVREDARGKQLGERLKQYQREVVRDLGEIALAEEEPTSVCKRCTGRSIRSSHGTRTST